MYDGKFISIEGIEGVGKSTHMDHLVGRFEAAGHKVLTSREPGGTPTGERIRDVVLGHADEPIPDIAELLLMFASRSLLVENVIRPALSAGTWVVCDRFVDASRAYQGGGRGLPMAQVDQLADWVLGDLRPDVTVLLDAPVDIGLSRAGSRGNPDRAGRGKGRILRAGKGLLPGAGGSRSGALHCRGRVGGARRGSGSD